MQTKKQAINAELFAKWLIKNKPHITMKEPTEYKNLATPISFICLEHGEYIARPDTVKRTKYGCKQCEGAAKQSDFSAFVNSAKDIHGDKYSYDELFWRGITNKTKIFCKSCEIFFEQTGSNHLKGHGCVNCSNKARQLPVEEFICAAQELHGDMYIYDKTNWKGAKNKIKIFCKTCNNFFEQIGNNHLAGRGCPVCANKSKQLPFSEFVKSAIIIHSDNYEYDETTWNGSNSKTKILCKACNKFFEQTGSNHLQGQGCPVCNISGFDNEKNFARNPELANEPCKLYYIKINGYYKIGITKQTLSRRYSGQQFEILLIRETTRLFAWRTEQRILSEFAEYRQKGDINGGGSTECFDIDISTLNNFKEIFNHDFITPQ